MTTSTIVLIVVVAVVAVLLIAAIAWGLRNNAPSTVASRPGTSATKLPNSPTR